MTKQIKQTQGNLEGYYTAFKLLMSKSWDLLPLETQNELNKQFKELKV
jgi:hypothetical protein